MNKNSGTQKECQPKGGRRKAEGGRNALAPLPPSTLPHPPSRRGLTLIELLVTIVIMVTVLAGVLPLVSPNNSSRKIREASRQLNSLLAQAQAQAARDGRPVGVAFREAGTAGNYSGVALEAYTIAVPPPFAGFSEHSRVAVLEHPEKLRYGKNAPARGNGGTMFEPRLIDAIVWRLEFSLYGQPDPIPPRTIRNGDTLDINGNQFLVVDDDGSAEGFHQIDQATGYLQSTHLLNVVWLNSHGQLPPQGRKPYSFARLPVNTAEQPLQFPRGIAIDMEASGTEGIAGLEPPSVFDAVTGEPDVVGVMFSPNGSLEQLYLNGESRFGVEQVYLLLGLVENGNGNALDENDYDFAANQPADASDVAARRSRVNWLNPDSRWVSVNRAGRIITAENNISFEPWKSPHIDNLNGSTDDKIDEQRRRQINDSRQNARNMTGSTGR